MEANIEHGERAALFIQSEYGQERGTLLLNKLAARGNGSQPRFPRHPETVDSDDSAPSEDDAAKDRCLPYGFWRKFMVEELAILPSGAKNMQMLRSLKFYLQRKREGAITRASMRGMRAATSCRNSGVLATDKSQQAYASRCCSSSWTMCSDCRQERTPVC